jgi:hypothetical protein
MLAILSAPAGLVSWPLVLPAIAGALWLLALALLDAASVAPPVGVATPRRVRSLAVVLHLLQPAARLWGRLPGIAPIRRNRRRQGGSLSGPAHRLPGGVLLLPLTTSRIELAKRVVSCLHQSGRRVAVCGPWEDFDALVHGSTLITGRLVTSAHPEGSMQLRIDRRVRRRRLALLVAAIAALAIVVPLAALGLAVVGALETARGIWRAGPGARAVIERTALADA